MAARLPSMRVGRIILRCEVRLYLGTRTAKVRRGRAGTMAMNERAPNGGEQRIVRIEDLPDLYPGQWVLMQVVKHRGDAPVAGIVLAAGSEEHIQSVLMEDIQSGGLRGPYYRFFATRYTDLDPDWMDEWEEALIEEMLIGSEGR
jgi:hypothetical protein